MSMETISHSRQQTLRIGRRMAKYLRPGDIVCLFGRLGCGKTVLTKGIAEGLGIGASRVISPTFVLIREHEEGRIPLFHFDLYRLGQERDIAGLGYEEYLFGNGVSVIEWADRLRRLMPKEFLKVNLSVTGESERRLSFSAKGSRYKDLLEKIHENTPH
mgnify:CR=1 FL=1